MQTAVIYARVSSKEQEREGYSIPAQLELIRGLAQKRNFEIVEEFIDVESAKQAGRTNFGAMIKFLKSNRVDAIICHKVDRLCRNFRDFVTVDELGIAPVFVEEEFPDNASGKLTYGLKVLLAKHYIDNLSDEVKKGTRQKIMRGEWPHLAPYGYRNGKKHKNLEIEPREAENVLYFFKNYATGHYSLHTLREKFRNDGRIYKDRLRLPSKSQLEKILKNPFYYGVMVIKGETYHGNHDAIIDKDLFDRVQGVFRAANKPKSVRRDFAYAGLMTCANCGCAITAEIKKGKYVYYHCTNGRGNCKPVFVRQESLDEQFEEAVRGLNFDTKLHDLIIRTLRDDNETEIELRKSVVQDLKKRKEMLHRRLDQAYTDKLDGIISEDLWREKSKSWTDELSEIEWQMNSKNGSGTHWLELGTKIIELAKNAYSSYLQADWSQKRNLLKILLSNSTLSGCKVHYSYKKPFDLLVEGGLNPNWLGS
ncbi:MAG TPA: recombinase family protein [bacterium]